MTAWSLLVRFAVRGDVVTGTTAKRVIWGCPHNRDCDGHVWSICGEKRMRFSLPRSAGVLPTLAYRGFQNRSRCSRWPAGWADHANSASLSERFTTTVEIRPKPLHRRPLTRVARMTFRLEIRVRIGTSQHRFLRCGFGAQIGKTAHEAAHNGTTTLENRQSVRLDR